MMTKAFAEERVKRTLLALNSPEMRPLLEALQQENGAVIQALMVTSDDTMMRQMQGRAQFVDELLRLVATAAR